MEQATLFNTTAQQKVIIHVDHAELFLSHLNPRSTRPPEYVKRLSERIRHNGYEITRAMWVYPDGDKYAVFAGGTRLQAVQMLDLESVPVVLHTGYSDGEIVRLADLDNENDEYHEPVSMVDVWMSYKALKDRGWTQAQIGKAKGVSQPTVKFMLKYADMPQSVIDVFSTNDFMTEGHAREIIKLVHCTNLTPWLTRESAMLHVIEKVTKRGMFTAKDFKSEVDKLNNVITTVERFITGIDKPWADDLLQALADKQAYTQRTAQRIMDNMTQEIAIAKRAAEDAKRIELEAAERERIAAERAAAEAAHRLLIESLEVGQWWQLGDHLLYCGDTSQPEFYADLPHVAFAFADPPYNADKAHWDNDFAWAHDWLSDKAAIVAVTPGISSIFEFAQITTMPYKWSLACWLCNGMTRGAVGFGNWIYTALFSQGSVYKQAQDHHKITITLKHKDRTKHPSRKPDAYIDWLVETFSQDGDTILDPFLGSGTTLLCSERMGRVCIGGEIDPEYCKDIIRQWEDMTGLEACPL